MSMVKLVKSQSGAPAQLEEYEVPNILLQTLSYTHGLITNTVLSLSLWLYHPCLALLIHQFYASQY